MSPQERGDGGESCDCLDCWGRAPSESGPGLLAEALERVLAQRRVEAARPVARLLDLVCRRSGTAGPQSARELLRYDRQLQPLGREAVEAQLERLAQLRLVERHPGPRGGLRWSAPALALVRLHGSESWPPG